MKLGVRNPRAWKQVVEGVALFIPRGVFHFSPQGAWLRAIDPSQVVLVSFFAKPSMFHPYEVEGEVLVPLDITEYSKILTRMLADDILKMEVTENELSVVLEKSDGRVSREFVIPLIDVTDKGVRVPEEEYPVKVTIKAKFLKEALKDASLFSSSVTFCVRNNRFYIEASGAQGSLRTVARPGAVGIDGEEEVTGKYSISFLQNILKQADPDSWISLHIKSDAPLKIEYSIEEAKMSYYLAHIII